MRIVNFEHSQLGKVGASQPILLHRASLRDETILVGMAFLALGTERNAENRMCAEGDPAALYALRLRLGDSCHVITPSAA